LSRKINAEPITKGEVFHIQPCPTKTKSQQKGLAFQMPEIGKKYMIRKVKGLPLARLQSRIFLIYNI
jgi:hypothetical protein